jgi:hypothetical protein
MRAVKLTSPLTFAKGEPSIPPSNLPLKRGRGLIEFAPNFAHTPIEFLPLFRGRLGGIFFLDATLTSARLR